MTSWIKSEQESNDGYQSFHAFVLSRHPEPGSSAAIILNRLCNADLPKKAVAWTFIKNHLVGSGWDMAAIDAARHIHDRYMQKAHFRHRLRRRGELREPR